MRCRSAVYYSHNRAADGTTVEEELRRSAAAPLFIGRKDYTGKHYTGKG